MYALSVDSNLKILKNWTSGHLFSYSESSLSTYELRIL